MVLIKKYSYLLIIPLFLSFLVYLYIFNFKKSFYHVTELKELSLPDRINIESFQQTVFNVLGENYGLIIKKYLSNEYFEEVYYNATIQEIRKFNDKNKFKIFLRKGILPQQVDDNLNLIIDSKSIEINNHQLIVEKILGAADISAKNELSSHLKSLLDLFIKFNVTLNAEEKILKDYEMNKKQNTTRDESDLRYIKQLIRKLKTDFEIASTLGISKSTISTTENLEVNSMNFYKFGTERIKKTIEKLESLEQLESIELLESLVFDSKNKNDQSNNLSKKNILYNSFDQMLINSYQFKIMDYNVSSMYLVEFPLNRYLLFLFYLSIVNIISGLLFFYFIKYKISNES
ncbi:MAG: hypothetical protein CMN79_02165 [Spirochaetales bacterium]|nr:hypothetical protein [Spirochaetales bacterium]